MRRKLRKSLSGILVTALLASALNVTPAFSSSDYEEPQEAVETVVETVAEPEPAAQEEVVEVSEPAAQEAAEVSEPAVQEEVAESSEPAAQEETDPAVNEAASEPASSDTEANTEGQTAANTENNTESQTAADTENATDGQTSGNTETGTEAPTAENTEAQGGDAEKDTESADASTEAESDTSSDTEKSTDGEDALPAEESEEEETSTDTEEIFEEDSADAAEILNAAISGPTTVKVGESITLTDDSTNSSYRYVWSVNPNWTRYQNTNVQITSYTASSVTLTGIAAGTTTIYHLRVNGQGLVTSYTPIQVTVVDEATFTGTMTNAEALLFHYSDSTGVWTLVGTFSAGTNSFQSNYIPSDKNNIWVVIAKGTDNYLLTGLTATGNGEYSPITSSTYSFERNIVGDNKDSIISSLHTLTGQYAPNYQVVFGYTTRWSTDGSRSDVTFSLTGHKPSITATAVPDKDYNLVPDQEIKLTLTVNPEDLTGDGLVSKEVSLSKLTIGGNSVNFTNGSDTITLTPDNDGNYSTEVFYTLTDTDCEGQYLDISVEGKATYGYKLNLTADQSVTTTSTVTATATTRVQIAESRTPVYEFRYVGDIEPSDDVKSEIIPLLPEDTTKYYYGVAKDVKVTQFTEAQKKIQDDENHGVWEFSGWYRNNDGAAITDKEISIDKDDSSPLQFVGYWTFKRNLKTLTVKKIVTGNMGDTAKNFTFTVEVKDGENKVELTAAKNGTDGTFTLCSGEGWDIKNIPEGASVSVTEDANSSAGYKTTYQIETGAVEEGYSAAIDAITADTTITFTNDKTVSAPTGLQMNNKVHLVLLGMALAMFAVVFLFRKKEYDAA